MKEKLEALLTKAVAELGFETSGLSVSYPKEAGHGDYMTNAALLLAKKGPAGTPRQIAETLQKEIEKDLPDYLEKMEIAGPGFINFYLSRSYYSNIVESVLHDADFFRGSLYAGKKIIVEYTQPNPFKPFHIGHLMANAVGESLVRLLGAQGANVIRANYQGDIGPHVAKALWGIVKKDAGIVGDTPAEKANYIGECYAYASDLYESDEAVKTEIDELNKKIYNGGDYKEKELYEEGRRVTLEAFEEIYRILGTVFDRYYFESEMIERGIALLLGYSQKGIFEHSDGAVVFHAEKYDPKLHTRVFITKHSTPTYETKELALTEIKFETLKPDLSIVTTAVEQQEYMKVVTEAIRQMFPKEKYADKMEHVTFGMMRFADSKMSSRKGNVITGESLLRDTQNAVFEIIKKRDYADEDKNRIAEYVAVAAIKYSILRSATGTDIIYDRDKSISFDGDSGPYLQYTTARANSVLGKAVEKGLEHNLGTPTDTTLSLEKILEKFPTTIARAALERQPHHLATYLVQLAGEFNSFYGREQIIKDDDESVPYKLAVTEAVHKTLTRGLALLGINVPEKM